MSAVYIEQQGFLPEGAAVRHGFFGRGGGKSSGIYATLNCGLATDDPSAAENRVLVAQALGGGPARLQTVYQVHGADCVYVEAPLAQRPRADALVTDVPGILLGILTADCVPVLFYGARVDGSPVIGAAHAGWKGALGGILESTVSKMCERGAQLPGLRAAIGPCIAKRSYEVSAGFEASFIARDPADAVFFTSARQSGKLLFDLPGYVARRLAACGVRRVMLADIDTVTNPQDYFSYRRAMQNGEPDTGRQISVMMIKGNP